MRFFDKSQPIMAESHLGLFRSGQKKEKTFITLKKQKKKKPIKSINYHALWFVYVLMRGKEESVLKISAQNGQFSP